MTAADRRGADPMPKSEVLDDRWRPRISVVIPTFNRADALGPTLEALAGQSLDAASTEILVVDDGSTDGASELLARWVSAEGPATAKRTVLRQANRGPAAARNAASHVAEGSVLLFLDDDMIAAPDLLERHLALHAAHPSALAMGRSEPWPEAWAATEPRVRRLLVGLPRADWGQDGAPLFVQHVFTNNLSMPAEVWSSVGGFAEVFPPGSGYEDMDFALRAEQAGHGILSCPSALAMHNHPLSIVDYLAKARRYQRSAPLLLARHPDLSGRVAHLRDKEPIDLRRDGAALLARKALRATTALPPLRRLLRRGADIAERSGRPGLATWLDWKSLGAAQYLGVRDGLAARIGSERRRSAAGPA